MTRFAWRSRWILGITALILTLTSTLALNAQNGIKPPLRDPQIGRTFQIPYRLTDTNHFLVRARINGKGPFNFLVDSGAPALFIATETGKKIGLKPKKGEFWTPIEQLDLEGGAQLTGLKARVEDPFQLVGMNALGLPGASIDGILGFTMLALFRLEIDLSRDRMAWTRLDYSPPDPPVPKLKPGEEGNAPLGIQAMNAIGPLAKGLAFLMGKQPEEAQHPRGFLGLEWSEQTETGQKLVRIQTVLKESPAAQGGLKPGDVIVKINDRTIAGLKDARMALAEIQPRGAVSLVIRRGAMGNARELELALTAGEGL
jgi:membrane-associated protease RseP (regulator of RpoE activity)